MIQPNNLRELIKFLRSRMSPAQRKRIYQSSPITYVYPVGTEREYARIIRRHQVDLVKFALDRLNYYLPILIREARQDTRFDGVNEDLEELMRELEVEVTRLYGGILITSSASFKEMTEIANKIFKQLGIKFERKIEVLAGTPLTVEYPWWDAVRTMWSNENYRLVKSLSSEYITKLNTLLVNGLQSGWELSEFQNEIMKLSDKMTGYRARLIARDQIGKLNSYIAERQARGIGMEYYIWRTSQDERVRGDPVGKYPRAIPSHFAMDNLFCTWNDTAIYSPDVGKTWVAKTAQMEFNHPGRSLACRCLSMPAWNIYAADIDSENGE